MKNLLLCSIAGFGIATASHSTGDIVPGQLKNRRDSSFYKVKTSSKSGIPTVESTSFAGRMRASTFTLNQKLSGYISGRNSPEKRTEIVSFFRASPPLVQDAMLASCMQNTGTYVEDIDGVRRSPTQYDYDVLFKELCDLVQSTNTNVDGSITSSRSISPVDKVPGKIGGESPYSPRQSAASPVDIAVSDIVGAARFQVRKLLQTAETTQEIQDALAANKYMRDAFVRLYPVSDKSPKTPLRVSPTNTNIKDFDLFISHLSHQLTPV